MTRDERFRPKWKWGKIFVAIGVVGAAILDVRASAASSIPDVMHFEMQPPERLYAAFSGDDAWTVYATGTIDVNAPDRLRRLTKKYQIPPHPTVYLNSLGGNLMAGMKLGRLFRDSEYTVYIGKRGTTREDGALPGQCFSACSLAFLGGKWRYITSGSAYGVHRFYFGKPSEHDADTAQVVSAIVVQYIRDMGVDPELFSEMTVAGREKIVLIPTNELERLNVVNNGQTPAVWSVESANGVVYLKGQRDSVFGLSKVLFACSEKGVLMTTVTGLVKIGATVGLPPTEAITLIIDNKEYPIEHSMDGQPQLYNGSVLTSFTLAPSLVRAIETGHDLSVTFQVARDAAMSFGFQGMRIGDGALKMPGVLHGCQ